MKIELNEKRKSSLKTFVLLAVLSAFIPIPPLLFEKYTFHLYLIGDPNFFTYSGHRLWFDIIWFGVAGVISALFVGREKRIAILPPLISSAFFVVAIYAVPFCEVRECYVSSTDGLAPIRDFLLFASLGVITSAATLKSWSGNISKNHAQSQRGLTDLVFQMFAVTMLGLALSFFPIMHIFAAVTVPYPENYIQWFLAGASAGLAGSMWLVDRGFPPSSFSIIAAGASGVVLNLLLALEIPCEDCSGYGISTVSILLLTVVFTLPAVLIWESRKKSVSSPSVARKIPAIITIVVIVVSIITMWGFFFSSNYQVSLVNGFSGVNNTSFSPLEVGRTFVYAAGYLAIPRVVSQAVGVNLTFGNTTLSENNFPNNFLAAGVGDQSPNCCKDGLDLAYRADAIEFTNGTQAVLARAWWACDVNMACGGYSWQQLLHLGEFKLPSGSLSNWIELEMNWTSPTLIQWFYKINFVSNETATPWTLYSSFVPPKIQNHYWDAGLYLVGAGNQPTDYAYFYQFGVSSAHPITQTGWQVTFHCPEIVLNGSWECIPKASFISGVHSFWKVLYTFGESYQGVSFSYLGNFTVRMYYLGDNSPPDGAPMW